MKIFGLVATLLLPLVSAAQSSSPLKLVQTIPLPGVEGRIDHMAFDAARNQLFVAALGNDSLEVVNLKTRTVKSLKGFSEPQGVVVLPIQGQVFVTNGGDGTGVFLNAETLEVKRRINIGPDADNVRIDGKRLFVGCGSALAVLDSQGEKQLDVKLGAHPESLQLETDKTGAVTRVFLNVPGAKHIAVVNLEKRAVTVTWPVPAASNFPMAFDSAHHRLLIATRLPARLIAFDTNTGKVTANLETVGGADDVFIDGSGSGSI
jgi:DNA-binding beta-propeller fold protein YncE